jgi:hypothetical protein
MVLFMIEISIVKCYVTLITTFAGNCQAEWAKCVLLQKGVHGKGGRDGMKRGSLRHQGSAPVATAAAEAEAHPVQKKGCLGREKETEKGKKGVGAERNMTEIDGRIVTMIE